VREGWFLGFLVILAGEDWILVVVVLAATRSDLRVASALPVRNLALAAAMRVELLVAMTWMSEECRLLMWWSAGDLYHGVGIMSDHKRVVCVFSSSKDLGVARVFSSNTVGV
jgi:hypothetical protein